MNTSELSKRFIFVLGMSNAPYASYNRMTDCTVEHFLLTTTGISFLFPIV